MTSWFEFEHARKLINNYKQNNHHHEGTLCSIDTKIHKAR